MQRSGRQSSSSSAREGRATPESRQRLPSGRVGGPEQEGRTTPSSRHKSGRETPESARQRRLQEESRRVVEARRAQEESRRAQEEQVSQRRSQEEMSRRSQEESNRRSQEQSHWRREEEMQGGATKKSSYYFGEEPELSNGGGGIDLQDEGDEDSLTPTEEREGVREHAGEVVRIRVPYTEQDLTQQYNIQRLNAQKISPRFNGHKVTIQVSWVGSTILSLSPSQQNCTKAIVTYSATMLNTLVTRHAFFAYASRPVESIEMSFLKPPSPNEVNFQRRSFRSVHHIQYLASCIGVTPIMANHSHRAFEVYPKYLNM